MSTDRRFSDIKEGNAVSLTLNVKSGKGEKSILVVSEPRRKLEELQRKGEVTEIVSAQDILAALSISQLNAQMAVPSPVQEAAVNYGIEAPLSYFADIGDPELFRSQVVSFLSQAVKHYNHSKKEGRDVTFILRKKEALTQKGCFIEAMMGQANTITHRLKTADGWEEV